MILFFLTFFYFWAIFWSFSTVLIERWHSGKWGIISWRSQCPHCKNILKARDLFPIFSYIWNGAKCSFCKTPISGFYLVAEILMGVIFTVLAYSAIQLNMDVYSIKFAFLLALGFTTGVYVLYDLRYMEIPDQIMVPTIWVLLLIPILSILFDGYTSYTFHTFPISIGERLYWAIILYTFFYIQILIPAWYHFIKKLEWRHLWELIISYITFPIVIIIDFFRKKREEQELEIPTWVWWGDLRIAIFIGLTLGVFHGIASFAFAYIIGSVVWILIIFISLIRWKKINSQIPFGPFLWLWWILSILFYTQIEDIFLSLI